MEQIAISSCNSYDFKEVKRVVDRQFDLLQFDSLVKSGAQVVIKPNLIMKSVPENAAITHPIVTAAVEMCIRDSFRTIFKISKTNPFKIKAGKYSVNLAYFFNRRKINPPIM